MRTYMEFMRVILSIREKRYIMDGHRAQVCPVPLIKNRDKYLPLLEIFWNPIWGTIRFMDFLVGVPIKSIYDPVLIGRELTDKKEARERLEFFRSVLDSKIILARGTQKGYYL